MMHQQRLPVFLLYLLLLYVLLLRSLAAAAQHSPEEHFAQGARAYQQGDFRQAVVSWTTAAQLYENTSRPTAHSLTLTHLAQAYHALGHYRQALSTLQAARTLAEKNADHLQLATILGRLGTVHMAIGPATTATEYFHRALAMAQALGKPRLIASILNDLGSLLTAQNQPQEALDTYRHGIQFARHAGDPAMLARVLTNAATAAQLRQQYQVAKTLLDEAIEHTRGLEPSHDRAYGLLKIGLAYHDLQPHVSDPHQSPMLRSAEAFQAAASTAQALADALALSYAWGHLGHLYESTRRYTEALELTRRAILAVQPRHAPEALYRWQWQTGRILKAQGDLPAAIAAYRRAVTTLQTIRPELATAYGKPPVAFRTSPGVVYFELVGLLLQHAATTGENSQPTLQEARQTIELFKAAELRDYFRDDCVDAARARAVPLDTVARQAAVVYPIILPGRLELLVSLPGGLQRFPVQVDEPTLVRTVRGFREGLQEGTTRRYLRHAQRLYDWLIRPFEMDLVAANIHTVVFVPDGALRTVPMAALHDGRQFLVSKYALATTPGLDLTDPRTLPRQRLQVLAGGLAVAVQDFMPLPHVPDELRAVQQFFGGKVLLNQDFSVTRVEREMEQRAFDIVHIASHGEFTSDVTRSFILTFDDRLTLDRLAQVVGRLRLRNEPLELLTLSACETALGDDRAALGLAGVAIKAGARSALATLWRVQNEATTILVSEFYRQL
jgi:CHAT domain-containing protein